MKKITALFICAVLIFALTGCASIITKVETESDAQVTIADPSPAATAETVMPTAEIPTSAPTTADAQPSVTDVPIADVGGCSTFPETLNEQIIAMMPFFDATIRAMNDGAGMEFNSDDPEFFWTLMYLLTVNSYELNGITIDNTNAAISSDTLEELAHVAFGEFAELPAIPEIMSETVVFDSQNNVYTMPLSDTGDTTAALSGYSSAANGGALVDIVLLDSDGYIIDSVSILIAPNQNVSESAQNPFYYYIEGASQTIG